MEFEKYTPAALRDLILEDRVQLATWQQQLNAYFENEEPIAYLDETREIAHYLMELNYELKGLERSMAKVEQFSRDRQQLNPKVLTFHERVNEFKSYFEAFLGTSKAASVTAV